MARMSTKTTTAATAAMKSAGRPTKASPAEPTEKRRRGRPAKVAVSEEKVQISPRELEELQNQASSLRLECEDLRRELASVSVASSDFTVILGPAASVPSPVVGTHYFYARASLCPVGYVVQPAIWSDSFFDWTRFVGRNYFEDYHSCKVACANRERIIAQRWKR